MKTRLAQLTAAAILLASSAAFAQMGGPATGGSTGATAPGTTMSGTGQTTPAMGTAGVGGRSGSETEPSQKGNVTGSEAVAPNMPPANPAANPR